MHPPADEDTDHLAQRGARVGHGRKDAFGQHGVKRAGRERKRFGPARHEVEIGPGRPRPRDLRRRGVDPDRSQPAAIREMSDGGAAPAADVEHPRAPGQPGQSDDPVGELETARPQAGTRARLAWGTRVVEPHHLHESAAHLSSRASSTSSMRPVARRSVTSTRPCSRHVGSFTGKPATR